MLWMNGTDFFVATHKVDVTEYDSLQTMQVWNINKPDPIKSFNFSKPGMSVGDALYYLAQAQEYDYYLVIAGGYPDVKVSVLNLQTGEYVYEYRYDTKNEFGGFTLNENRYSFTQTYNDQYYRMLSVLSVFDPKKKVIDFNITIYVNMSSYEPQFTTISAFNSKLNGNNLIATLGNGSFFILDTLTKQILGTYNFQTKQLDDFFCYSINDEVQALMYCLSQGNLTIFSGTQPELIDYIELTVGGITNIPESQEMLYVEDQAIKSWKYKTQKNESIIS